MREASAPASFGLMKPRRRRQAAMQGHGHERSALEQPPGAYATAAAIAVGERDGAAEL